MNFPARVVHPEHGAMHVYNQADLEKLQKRGWEAEHQEEVIAEEKPKRKYTRKPK